jgi:hypothetical protein
MHIRLADFQKQCTGNSMEKECLFKNKCGKKSDIHLKKDEK